MAAVKRAKHTNRGRNAKRAKRAAHAKGRQAQKRAVVAKQKAEPKAKPSDTERTSKRGVNVSIPEQGLAKRAIDDLLMNGMAVEYLKKNVSKRAVDVVNMLAAPKTDEGLAEQLGMKINAIRRILNIMHGYGITNYYVSKNTNGWLSFSWYINANKVQPFLDYIDSIGNEKPAVDENANDYFICNGCYKDDKFVYTFGAAFETGFKCNSCKSNLERLDRNEVEALLNAKEEAASETSEAV